MSSIVELGQPRRIVGVRLLLVVLAIAATTSVSSIPEGSIEDFAVHELLASGAPGLAYAVVSDGKITTVQGYGVVTKGGDAEVTGDTPFVTGSVSKGFTALAVMQLVEGGEVDLDTGISHYLDDFSRQPTGTVTIRQLLSHTSGYFTRQGNSGHADVSGGKDELARRVEGLATEDPAHGLGERWEYSNANYLIRLFQPDFGLALIASGVGGVLWAVFRIAVACTGRETGVRHASG